MATNIRDLAKRLNLSVSTVSYALNGGPRPVTPEIRDRVLSLASELDYRPNRIAKLLSIGRSMTIGIVPMPPVQRAFTSPYFHAVLNGVLEACRSSGFDTLIYTTPLPQSEGSFIDQLLDGRADGFVFVDDVRTRQMRAAVSERQIPVVTIGGGLDDPGYLIKTDNTGGIRSAIRHLHHLGHRKLAFLAGILGHEDADERLSAFRSECEHLGLEVNEDWIRQADFQVAHGETQTHYLLTQPVRPTAIVCSNDESALGAMRAAYKQGIVVPRDLSITGFDDFNSAWALSPALTTVRPHTTEMGHAAAEVVFQLLRGECARQQTIFPSELIVRETTSTPKEELLS